jgi:hypothetical protein
MVLLEKVVVVVVMMVVVVVGIKIVRTLGKGIRENETCHQSHQIF